ncbi:unnamed protein product [Brassica napus]|uniref:(rape) hypothetical protein n=1 Tax=Brassica napus TaxID=3708 RepID=A0A816VX22_BRANA|nr:unnamed protein product [Brassica napus]CAF2133054.1 unnamed protein product [Brassica napus]
MKGHGWKNFINHTSYWSIGYSLLKYLTVAIQKRIPSLLINVITFS